ncbi:MAG: hypothetical protein IT444_06440 [Phycisphaeraceae bacterium]|nr:hypothetical protein [Phycisphaeraceae bacterium]
MKIRAHYYEQFDADHTRDIPAEAYGGWKSDQVEISPAHTALVLMHATDCGTQAENAGWFRACEEIPRTYKVCRQVMPDLFTAVRSAGLPLIHVVDGGNYYQHLPGYQRAVALTGWIENWTRRISRDATADAIAAFRRDRSFPGKHNIADINRASPHSRFLTEAQPVGQEGIAATSDQLDALCREAGVNHLIYAGFNIDWCLLMSQGGMLEMNRRGYICSALRQAVTAVENKETARRELCKEIGLWRVSVEFGLVFDVADFIDTLQPLASERSAASLAGPGRAVPCQIGSTWIEADGEIYGAKPDETGPLGGGSGYKRTISSGNVTVKTVDELVAALALAKSGDVVFVDRDAALDITEYVYLDPSFAIHVPAGVTLASSRGHQRSNGGLIYSDALQTKPMIEALGPDVRITGLRLRGPDPHRRLAFHYRAFVAPLDANKTETRDQIYYKLPNSVIISSKHDNLEVDNCDISGASCAGIMPQGGVGHHFHHNYIHHNRRMGLGYGITIQNGQALIQRNVFRDNKHHIASAGRPGSGYEACHNVVLPDSEPNVLDGKPYRQDHQFDVHGGSDRQDGTDIAGEKVFVHHNTFQHHSMALCVRGVPQKTAEVHHNWFRHEKALTVDASGACGQPLKTVNLESPLDWIVVMTEGNTRVYDNAYGSPPLPRLGLDQVSVKEATLPNRV